MSLLTLLASLLGCTGERPADLGVVDGVLRSCPDSPNCVSSYDTRESHAIEPLQGSLEQVKAAIAEMDRAVIINEEENYLHAEFTSRLMRFVDDVEFLADPVQGIVHVRSASRIGRSDLGVNRERIETIRSLMNR